jgi:hypothetical protein
MQSSASVIPGSSKIYRHPDPQQQDLPPTPPVDDLPQAPLSLPFKASASVLNFKEPAPPPRTARSARRPASGYPAPRPDSEILFTSPRRKYPDPAPRSRRYSDSDSDDDEERLGESQQLDVDLEAYSTSTEDGLEDSEPTLSFITTSTAESTASTPSMNSSYAFQSEIIDGKPAPEPRVRMRTTTGRAHAYSSAESSTASGAFSYHPYENQIFHPHPPPMPPVPHAYMTADHVGLGITDLIAHQSGSDSNPTSPTTAGPNAFSHRPWRPDALSRLRSDSASSSITTASVTTTDTAASAGGVSADHAHAYPYSSYHFVERPPWEADSPEIESEAEAVALVDEGREKVFDMERLEAMGGLGALTHSVIAGLAGEIIVRRRG